MIRFMSDTRYAGLEKEMQHMVCMNSSAGCDSVKSILLKS